MANAFELRIVTPRAQVLDETVREVTAPGTLGEFGVLPDHIQFLTSLEIGVVSYKTNGTVHKIAVRGGFAEVANNVMTILADDAVRSERIDANAARSDLQSTESALQHAPPVDDEYAAADANRRWAQARLAAAAS